MTDREACRRALAECQADLIISLRRDLRIPGPRHGRCRAGGTDDRHQLSRAGELPGGASAAAVCRQSRSAGKFNGALAAPSSRRGVWRLQSGANLVCQQPAPGLGTERHCHHGGLAGIRRYPLTRKNDFPMPGQVSVEQAVKTIRRGLAKVKIISSSRQVLACSCACWQGSRRSATPTVARDGTLMNIAIIGSGIAGLTCAWRLAGQHQVALFEAASTPGTYRHGGYRHAAGYMGHRYRVHRLQRSHLSALYGLLSRTGPQRSKTQMSFRIIHPQSRLECITATA